MALSVVEILNLSLTRIKYPTPIGHIFEGSVASRVAIQIYGQTRDALFAERDWPFLRTEVFLGNPTKTAPAGGYGITPWDPATNPQVPWRFQYNYPENCVEVRSLRPVPILIPEFTPQFVRFVTAHDNDADAKVILTNIYRPIAVMTGQINDPAQWLDASFTEALIDALAVQFEKRFGPDINAIQLAERDAQNATNIADQRRG